MHIALGTFILIQPYKSSTVDIDQKFSYLKVLPTHSTYNKKTQKAIAQSAIKGVVLHVRLRRHVASQYPHFL
jgi:hypothetical protein